MWKPVISKATLDWIAAQLPEGQREQFAASVDVYPSEPAAEPVVEIDRERLAADLDRIRREDEARRKPGATSTFTAIDEIRGWHRPKRGGKTEQYRRDLAAWVEAYEKATGRKPDMATVGGGKPQPVDRVLFDYGTWAATRPTAPAGKPTFEWSAAPDQVDKEQFLRAFQEVLARADYRREDSRRFHSGEWRQSRSDDPEVKPYHDVIDQNLKELARETGTPEELLGL